MVRNQLLCVVIPVTAAHAAQVQALLQAPATAEAFDAMFRATRIVHFACIAVLPAAGSGPELLIELAVDPGLPNGTVVDTVVDKGLDLLQALLGPCIERGATSAVEETRLRALLRTHLGQAQGGYIGVRDRTVDQIHQEAALFVAVRDTVAARRRARPLATSRELAAEARKVIAPDGPFAFARRPSPRSFWRATGLTPLRRLLLIMARLVVPALLALVAVLGALSVTGLAAVASGGTSLGWDVALGAPVFGHYTAYARWAVLLVLLTLAVLYGIGAMLRFGVLSITAAIGVVFLFAGVYLAVPLASLSPEGYGHNLVQFGGALGVLVLWGLAVLVYLTALAVTWGLLFVVSLLVSPPHLGLRVLLPVYVALLLLQAVGWHLLVNLAVHHPASPVVNLEAIRAMAAARPWHGIPAIDITLVTLFVFSLLAAVVLRLAWRVLHRVGVFFRRADKVPLRDTPAVQQCHPSIEACEAALVGRVGHMISVTDVRGGPAWWRAMLRLFLRTIMFLGESWFTENRLGNAEGIKFGHWHITPDGRRLVFCSNFDGAFGAYLDEFILGASQGINLTWRWTELRERQAALPGHPGVSLARTFPKTLLLVFRGCKHEQGFKAFARDSMVPHLYRFEAYGHSNQDIARATRLRDALCAPAPGHVENDRIMRAVES